MSVNPIPQKLAVFQAACGKTETNNGNGLPAVGKTAPLPIPALVVYKVRAAAALKAEAQGLTPRPMTR